MAASDVKLGSQDEDVLNEAMSWQKTGKKVAIATVVSSWGSSPALLEVKSLYLKMVPSWAPFPEAASKALLSPRLLKL